MILTEYREELDLEFRWMNPPPPEMNKKWKIYEKLKRKGQSLDVDENTFAIKNKEEEERYKWSKVKYQLVNLCNDIGLNVNDGFSLYVYLKIYIN